MRLFFIVVLICLTVSPTLAAKSNRLIGVFKDWNAFAVGRGSSRVCYMGALPVKEEGKYKRRGPTYIWISHRPTEGAWNVIEVRAGYTYKPGSNVSVKIGSAKFSLFIKGTSAWARDAKTDANLVKAMRAGNRMVVTGRSSRGTLTKDTYSLQGFTAAHKKINKACKTK